MDRKDKAFVAVAVAVSLSTVVLSMALNIWAFTKEHPGLFGTSLGVLLPLWVLALTYAGKHLGHSADTGKRVLAIAAYILAGFLLVVSMPHLASGFASLGLSWWESWSLAVVTDLTQVIMKAGVMAILAPAALPAAPARKPRRRNAEAAPAPAAEEPALDEPAPVEEPAPAPAPRRRQFDPEANGSPVAPRV